MHVTEVSLKKNKITIIILSKEYIDLELLMQKESSREMNWIGIHNVLNKHEIECDPLTQNPPFFFVKYFFFSHSQPHTLSILFLLYISLQYFIHLRNNETFIDPKGLPNCFFLNSKIDFLFSPADLDDLDSPSSVDSQIHIENMIVEVPINSQVTYIS